MIASRMRHNQHIHLTSQVTRKSIYRIMCNFFSVSLIILCIFCSKANADFYDFTNEINKNPSAAIKTLESKSKDEKLRYLQKAFKQSYNLNFETLKSFEYLLRDKDEGVRYWGVKLLLGNNQYHNYFIPKVQPLLYDSSDFVKEGLIERLSTIRDFKFKAAEIRGTFKSESLFLQYLGLKIYLDGSKLESRVTLPKIEEIIHNYRNMISEDPDPKKVTLASICLALLEDESFYEVIEENFGMNEFTHDFDIRGIFKNLYSKSSFSLPLSDKTIDISWYTHKISLDTIIAESMLKLNPDKAKHKITEFINKNKDKRFYKYYLSEYIRLFIDYEIIDIDLKPIIQQVNKEKNKSLKLDYLKYIYFATKKSNKTWAHNNHILLKELINDEDIEIGLKGNAIIFAANYAWDDLGPVFINNFETFDSPTQLAILWGIESIKDKDSLLKLKSYAQSEKVEPMRKEIVLPYLNNMLNNIEDYK